MIDLHCDALLLADSEGRLKGQVTVEKLKRGGALAQCFAVFLPPARACSYEAFLDRVSCYRRLLARESALAPARSAEELFKNKERKKISAILTVEGAGFLKGREAGWEELFSLGVRMTSLTWNHPNYLGFPCSEDPQRDALGLTKAGEEAVERMQALGILLDVSHLSRGGFARAAEILRAPFVASHSCCYELCPHPRNLRDDQLRLLGERGGVMGLNYYAPFLRRGGEEAALGDLLAHARHVVRVAGIEALALGSDFDGIDRPVFFGDWAGIGIWREALIKEFGSEGAERICVRNFLRVWKEAERSVGSC